MANRSIAGNDFWSHFALLKPISRGAFGKVFLARDKEQNRHYAVKIMKKTEMLQKNMACQVRAERDALALQRCSFCVQLYYSYQSSDHIYLVMEYMIGGDLKSLLTHYGRFDEKMATFYAAEVALALDYLHCHGIIHRDVKPDNMLVNRRGHVKLTDFGLSKITLPQDKVKALVRRTKTPSAGVDFVTRTPGQLSSLTSYIGFGSSMKKGYRMDSSSERHFSDSSFEAKYLHPEMQDFDASSEEFFTPPEDASAAASSSTSTCVLPHLCSTDRSSCLSSCIHCSSLETVVPARRSHPSTSSSSNLNLNINMNLMVSAAERTGSRSGRCYSNADASPVLRRISSPSSSTSTAVPTSPVGSGSFARPRTDSQGSDVFSPTTSEEKSSTTSSESSEENKENFGLVPGQKRGYFEAQVAAAAASAHTGMTGDFGALCVGAGKADLLPSHHGKRRKSHRDVHLLSPIAESNMLAGGQNQGNFSADGKFAGSPKHLASTPVRSMSVCSTNSDESILRAATSMRSYFPNDFGSLDFGSHYGFHEASLHGQSAGHEKLIHHPKMTPDSRHTSFKTPDESLNDALNGSRVLGTPDYLAPELLLHRKHDSAVDWWSLGVCLYEFLNGFPPFNDDSPEEIFSHIMNLDILWPEGEEALSQGAMEAVHSLLVLDPRDRLKSLTQLKPLPLFEAIDWDHILDQEGPFVPAPDDDLDTDYFEARNRAQNIEVSQVECSPVVKRKSASASYSV